MGRLQPGLLVHKYKNSDAAAGLQAQILTQPALPGLPLQSAQEKPCQAQARSRGTQFTCFTSTDVQILTPEELLEAYQAQKEEAGEEFYRDHNSLAYGGAGFQPAEEKVEGMVQNLLDAAERRNKFSRRRQAPVAFFFFKAHVCHTSLDRP